MHRGSSKDGRPDLRPSESLPLSASPPTVRVEVEVVRAGASRCERFDVPVGTPVRVAVRRVGAAPEGAAALIDDRSVPMDQPIDRPTKIVVVPTFSGG